MLPEILSAAGVVVLIAGRFHPLLRDVSARGDFPTRASAWLRTGSLILANLLLLAALVVFVMRAN
jgi:hypothetical protein